MLRRVRVGAGQAEAPVGGVGRRRPHLLAVDHPLVAVARRRGCSSDARSEPEPGSLKSWHHDSSPRSIGSRNRFFCSSVPWAISVGPGHVDPDHEEVGGHVEVPLLLRHHAGLDAGAALPAVLDRPVRRRPARLELGALPRAGRLEVGGVVLVGLGPERLPVPSPSPRRLATDSSHARASARTAASAGVSSTSMSRTGSSFWAGGTVEPVDLPVMPPVKPMLAKAVHEVPHDRRAALRAEVGRVPLHRVPRRRRDRARVAQRPPAHPLLPGARRPAAGRAARAVRGRR